jgi:hypothetical protein
MTTFKGPRFDSFVNPPQPARNKPTPTAHPHRALPPGKQWLPHEKVGGKAAQRRLRQAARLEEKRRRKAERQDAPQAENA